ncbi:LOB domain-containing protein 37-like [Panicum miliaceum]|uniref:LOB domain-containing protein 37-like n=1 Tax=Panicum miliaceum TaxID=4540 RepID=A0A3L6TIY8_PANMI|nr:LOB domain-containing protein 37-like [Panicum miliaceum]
MSCSGCRVLRKGCSEGCVLRPCLQWIDAADAQGHATVFVAKFFGRAGLLSFISAVPDAQRPALFQSLLYEAAGRTINPVHGAVGLLGTGNWHLCQAAVDTVLRGGAIGPLPELGGGCGAGAGSADLYGPGAGKRAGGWSTFSTAKRVRKAAGEALPPAAEASCDLGLCLSPGSPPAPGDRRAPLLLPGTPSMSSDESVTTTTGGDREPLLLNLFP